MLPSFDLKKSFDPILCVFLGKTKENSRRVKEKARNRENREGMLSTSLKPKHSRLS